MQKNKTRDEERKRKPHRLSLNRETIRVLGDPALLELARGGMGKAEDTVVDASAGGYPRCAGTTSYMGC